MAANAIPTASSSSSPATRRRRTSFSNGLLALLRSPAEKERLVDSPALAETAVEELLRYDGPAKIMPRIAAEDLELRGKRIARGQRIFLVQSAANRDPAKFADPDRLDVGLAPNDHVAFGYGIHHCLGAPLARLEGRIAFTRLFERLPRIRLEADLVWRGTILGRGLEELPVWV